MDDGRAAGTRGTRFSSAHQIPLVVTSGYRRLPLWPTRARVRFARANRPNVCGVRAADLRRFRFPGSGRAFVAYRHLQSLGASINQRRPTKPPDLCRRGKSHTDRALCRYLCPFDSPSPWTRRRVMQICRPRETDNG